MSRIGRLPVTIPSGVEINVEGTREIIGLAGLVGAGRTEVARAVFGADPALGELRVRGKPARWKSPRDAMAEALMSRLKAKPSRDSNRQPNASRITQTHTPAAARSQPRIVRREWAAGWHTAFPKQGKAVRTRRGTQALLRSCGISPRQPPVSRPRVSMKSLKRARSRPACNRSGPGRSSRRNDRR